MGLSSGRLLKVIRLLICLTLTLSLFVPWSYNSGFYGFGGEMIGYVTLGFMVFIDPKILCLPVYFFINLWFGRDYLWLVNCRLLSAGVSFYLLMHHINHIWASGLFSYYVRWGYRLVLLTMGIAVAVELYQLSLFIKDELSQRKRKNYF
ncbi:hypothetical protein C1752_04323 [Acaryochloris thomasi RCC1774]|uniref:Uncharacterized protein n=1 Tax=Acaryochloris thomasi RCC1774 TaxID=1764569 RepID=A0A2W1JKI3_9CYAN|nr:hypothetical protein [Acaryochloris thomasi]PZD71975.1 hypothetical protein C1752_04323 [Acaryochloris thomasi RCC1774]